MNNITKQSSSEICLTENAAKRVQEMAASEGNDALMLRLAVNGGGCSGFQYVFSLDDHINDDDQVFDNSGTKLLIDDISLDFLKGSTVDFKNELGGSYFHVDNPNATAGCGCGTSFSV